MEAEPLPGISSYDDDSVDESKTAENKRVREESTKTSLFQSLCALCGQNRGKYRCPACDTVTCSLDCAKKHKINQECSGIRHKTTFVPLDNFNDGVLAQGNLNSH